MKNILDAIISISKLNEYSVNETDAGSNRVLHVGKSLEEFIKNAFADSFQLTDKNELKDKYNAVFSYQGSSRTPPDLMIKGGPAIEVKKTESLSSELQLNSSHPKNKLYSSSTLINKHCRNCETWDVKDFIYSIGHIPKGTKALASLWLIYGDIYAADEEVYLDLKEDLTANIEQIPRIDFSPTKELGRVNQVDPLKITNLRIRGMWLLKPPYSVFDYIHNYDKNKNFQCFAIIPTCKFNELYEDRYSDIFKANQIEVLDVKVKDPNNPVNLIPCKFITFFN